MRDLPNNKKQQKEGCLFLTILLILSIIGLVILTMTGCSQPSNVDRQETRYIVRSNELAVEIVVLDSCEYFYGPWGNATVLTHKGNCKHCKNK